MTETGTTSRRRVLLGTNALLLVGGVIAVLGGVWWGLDADPARGRWLLAIGAVVMMAALLLMGRLSARGQKVVLVVAVVLAVVAMVDGVQLVQTVQQQRSASAS